MKRVSYVISEVNFEEGVVDEVGGETLLHDELEELGQPLLLTDEHVDELLGVGLPKDKTSSEQPGERQREWSVNEKRTAKHAPWAVAEQSSRWPLPTQSRDQALTPNDFIISHRIARRIMGGGDYLWCPWVCSLYRGP